MNVSRFFMILLIFITFVGLAYLVWKYITRQTKITKRRYQKLKSKKLMHYTGESAANSIFQSENQVLLKGDRLSDESKNLNKEKTGTCFFINKPNLLNQIYHIKDGKNDKVVVINPVDLNMEYIYTKFGKVIFYEGDYRGPGEIEEANLSELYYKFINLYTKKPNLTFLAIFILIISLFLLLASIITYFI